MAVRYPIGRWKGVSIEVAAWDGVAAEVDVSVACLFSHELGMAAPHGGLAHLDAALGGALLAKRNAGGFDARPMETLELTSLPVGVEASTVLVIGLGQPEQWKPEVSAQAVATALEWVLQREVHSCAFAPSLLDSGLSSGSIGHLSALMLQTVLDGLDAYVAAHSGQEPAWLRRWVFDAGASHIDSAVARYRAAFSTLRPPSADQA